MEIENMSTNLDNKVKWSPFLRQINVCVTVWCFYFICGLFSGTPTVVRPQILKQNNLTTVISDNEDTIFSWITSISAFSGTCSIFVVILLAHFFGRKKTMTFLSIMNCTAAAVLCFSHSTLHIFISQLIYGIVLAGAMTVLPMVITEYSSSNYRGIFLTLKSATFFWGIWTANAIGIFTHYRYIGILALTISGYTFTSSFFMPESPYWLASNSKLDECILVHRLLKGETERAERELKDLLSAQQGRMKRKGPEKNIRNQLIHYFTIIRQPEIWKPITLCLLVFFTYDLSGKYVCAVYAIELMKKLTKEQSTAHIAVLILDGFSVLGMYLGSGLSKILKRRTMLLVTSTIGIIFLFVMSLYLYLIKLSIVFENPVIITAFLVGYSLAICCGPMIMSTCIFGELLPINSRSFSACLISSLYLTFSGIVTKVAPLMFECFGIHGSFLAYGISCSMCVILAYKYLPETKDKSLYEIAALFETKKPVQPAQIKLLQNTNTSL